MVVIRYCSSYPSDFTMDDPALKVAKYAVTNSLFIPNATQIFHREDTNENCVQRISENKSDIIPNWTALNVAAPHVKFFTITDQSSPVIISSYEPITSTSSTDVMSVCQLYEYNVLYLMAAMVVVVWLFFKTHSWIYRRHKRDLASIAEKITRCEIRLKTRQPTSFAELLLDIILDHYDSTAINRAGRKSLSFRLLFAFLLFTSFLLHFFFATSIKTSLVTVDKAVIISTFEEAYSRPGLQPKWLTYDSSWKNFRDAKAQSIMHKLWLRAKDHQPTFALGVSNGIPTISSITRQEIILIGQWVTMNIAYATLCPISRPFMGTRRMIMRSTDVLQQTAASVYNDRMDRRIARRIHTRTLRSQEGGIVQGILSKFEPPMNLRDSVQPELFRLCEQNRVEEAHAVVLQKTVRDFASLIAIAGVIVTLAVVRIAIELRIVQKLSRFGLKCCA